MKSADIERFSREYAVGEPTEGRLARALETDVPVWRELGNEILADLELVPPQLAADAARPLQRAAVGKRRQRHQEIRIIVLHLLGLDHKRLTYRYNGRDFRLTDIAGNVVTQIIA